MSGESESTSYISLGQWHQAIEMLYEGRPFDDVSDYLDRLGAMRGTLQLTRVSKSFRKLAGLPEDPRKSRGWRRHVRQQKASLR